MKKLKEIVYVLKTKNWKGEPDYGSKLWANVVHLRNKLRYMNLDNETEIVICELKPIKSVRAKVFANKKEYEKLDKIEEIKKL